MVTPSTSNGAKNVIAPSSGSGADQDTPIVRYLRAATREGNG
jgi:hypothetical protein